MKKSIKKISFLLTTFLVGFFSCQEKETILSELEGTVVFGGINLEFAPVGPPGSRVTGASPWVHVFPNSVDIILKNKATNRESTLRVNPNDFSVPYPIILPYGEYEYRTNIIGDVFSDFLPFEASGEFTHSSQNLEITINAETDYGLISVKNQYVEKAFVSEGSNQSSLSLREDGSYWYKYVKGGTPVILQIINKVTRETNSKAINVSQNKHYNFVLKLSNTEVTGIDLDPFELEEEDIVVELNPNFFEEKGIIKCPGTLPGEKGFVNGKVYEAVDRALLIKRRDENADLSCICTTLVTDLSNMFLGAVNFNQAIGSWDVSNVTNMSKMFEGARSFNQPIGNWDVSKVKSIYKMFYEAWAFNQPIGDWNTSNVENMAKIFYNAQAFNQPIGNWDISKVTDMDSMFDNASSFNQPIGNWDVSNVENMAKLFNRAFAFNQPLDNWNVSKVTNMDRMFSFARAFNQSLDSWNTSNVVDMTRIFFSASAFNGAIGNWDVGNLTDMSRMFFGASSFNQPIENWDVSNVTNMDFMFNGARTFNQSLNNWNTANVITMREMFGGASSFNGSINNWDVSNVTDMYRMFYNARLFNQPLNAWNTAKVTNMEGMFFDARTFNQPIGNWDVSKVKDMRFMFSRASLFNQDLSGWCVIGIPTQPQSFSTGSPLSLANRPLWGTCPD